MKGTYSDYSSDFKGFLFMYICTMNRRYKVIKYFDRK